MIGSLLPSTFPTGLFGAQDKCGDGAPAVRDAFASPLTDRHRAQGDDGKLGPRDGQHDFVHAAKQMVRNALKTFAHDLRDSFQNMGFQSDMVMQLSHDVMQAAKQALKNGADFTANLMMAAISQTSSTGAAGSSTPTPAFQMVAGGIEITINHSTRSVEVNAASVGIQGQLGASDGAATPQLVDFMDTEGNPGADAAPVLAMNDLASVLAGDGADGTGGQSEALAPLLDGLPQDAPDAAGNTDPAQGADPAEGADAAATEQSDGDAAPTGEDGSAVPDSQFSNVSHVIITAFQRYLNSEDQQVTYIKLDAMIPLSTSGPETSVAEKVAKQIAEQLAEQTTAPPAAQVIEAPVGQPATTDLLA